MTAGEGAPGEGAIRETYEEYRLGRRTFATIADPANDRAWVQSDLAVRVEP